MKEQENATGKGAESPVRSRFSVREIVLAIVAIAAIIAAIAGFSLYDSVRVPDGSAAKANDTYITEQSVADWIGQYRQAYSLTSDSDFAKALLSQNLNVSTFRQDAVNQLVLESLINKRAAELNVTPTDDQVQQQIDSAKSSLAFNSDEVWNQTLQSYGLTEDGLKSQYKTNLAQQAVLKADVPTRAATDAEVLSYMQSYLAGTTQKHAYRIVFSGSDASTRAQTCYQALQTAQAASPMNAQTFSTFAKQYSQEQDVQTTGGSYAWSGGSMGDTEKTVMENVAVGSFSEPESNDEDSTVEILFCDTAYTFPAKADLTVMPADIPEALRADVESAATSTAWTNDCNAYLSALIAAAKITYYPVPDGASYDVDMSLANS